MSDSSAFDGHYEVNQAMLAGQLILRHGYQLESFERRTFLKPSTDEQALVVTLSSKGLRKTSDQKAGVSLTFGIVRHDVNEYHMKWVTRSPQGLGREPWQSTVAPIDGGPFAPLKASAFSPFEEWWADLAEKLDTQASWTGLEDFERLLYGEHVRRDNAKWDRIINDALSGRDDRSREEYAELESAYTGTDAPTFAIERWEQFHRHYAEFRNTHPDGIR